MDPKQEVLERAAESSPLAWLPRLIMTENLRQSMADYRQRTREGHLAMAKAAGMGDVVGGSIGGGGGEDVGGISISGDVTHNHLPPAPKPALGAIAKCVISAALASGGGGAVMFAQWYLDRQLTAAPPPAELPQVEIGEAPPAPAAPTVPAFNADFGLKFPGE